MTTPPTALPLLAALLMLVPAAMAGTAPIEATQVCAPRIGENRTCVATEGDPTGGEEPPIGVKTCEAKTDGCLPECVRIACENECLQRHAVYGASPKTVSEVCGIPINPCEGGCENPCEGEFTAGDDTDADSALPEDVCGRPVPEPDRCTLDCEASPLCMTVTVQGLCEDDNAPCVGAAALGFECCMNGEGREVLFETYTKRIMPNYSVWILVEATEGTDMQKDIRIGWDNQVPGSDHAVTWVLQSSKNTELRHHPWFGWHVVPIITEVVSNHEGTDHCGAVLYATRGNTASPAVVQVVGYFSGISETKSEAYTTEYSSSTNVGHESTSSRTWSTTITASYSYKGPSGEFTHTEEETATETSTYSKGETFASSRGVIVTTTPTEWSFVSAPFEVG